jgi:hypothetical protein
VGGIKAEVERARGTLRHLIELSGLSRREVKRRLVELGSDTDLARLLSGRLDVKLRHVLELGHVLGIHPLEFFHIVFKEPEQRSQFLQSLDEVIAPGRSRPAEPIPGPSLPAGDLEELRQRVAKLARDVEQLKAAANLRRPR